MARPARPGDDPCGGVAVHLSTVFVRSANPIGAETVVRSLTRWNYQVRRATA
jgi:hypothetical protein